MRNSWKEVPVAELLEISIGGLWGEAPGGDDADVDVLRSTNFKNDGTLSYENVAKRSVRLSALDARPLRMGDVLLEKSGGGPKQPVGRVALVRHDPERAICGNFIQLLRPKDDVDPSWLFYALWFAHVRGVTLGYQTQTTGIRNLKTRDYLARSVLVPPIEEQRRIVDVVEAVDTATHAQARRAALAWQLLARMIDHRMNSHSWPVRRLDDAAEIGGGITKGGRQKDGTKPVPYLRVANVQHGRLDLNDVREIEATNAQIARHALQAGDVLLLEGGSKEEVGRGWIWSAEFDLCLHQNHLHRARANRAVVEPRFLAYAICSAEARAYCLINAKQTSNLATINRTQISGLPIRVPDLEEQRRMVGLLDAVRAEYEQATTAGHRLLLLRTALLNVLLSGTDEIPESYDRVLAENGGMPELEDVSG